MSAVAAEGIKRLPPPDPRRHRVNTETKAAQTRAYKRAMARLREEYRDRFQQLYDEELAAARVEIEATKAAAGVDQPLVPRTGHQVDPPRGPGGRPAKPPLPAAVRLKPGPRSERDVGPRLRDDVAGCQRCVGYHDRGHRCRACGSQPQGAAPNPFAQFNAGVERARSAGR